MEMKENQSRNQFARGVCRVGMITSLPLKTMGVGGKCEVNDIRVADIYPGADIKNGVRAGFVHDKNI